MERVKNMKACYPAIFIPYGGSFTVEFPDLPGCVTQGDSLQEAFEMAEDAACGWILTSIEDGEDVPSASSIKNFESQEGFVNYVTLDIDEYAKKYSTRAIKKTLTIPEWLNQLAERKDINFSKVLQDALKQKLGLVSSLADEEILIVREGTKKLEFAPTDLSTEFKQSAGNTTITHNAVDNVVKFPLPKVLSN